MKIILSIMNFWWTMSKILNSINLFLTCFYFSAYVNSFDTFRLPPIRLRGGLVLKNQTLFSHQRISQRVIRTPAGILRYFHTYVGSGHFWGFEILNFNVCVFFFFFFFFVGGGGGVKKWIFLGMEILWIFFGSSQNWTIFRGHSYAF